MSGSDTLDAARELVQAGRLREAARLLRQAIRARPEEAELHCELGNVLQSQGKLEKAIAAYEQALALDEHLVRGWYALGCAHAARKDHATAVPCFGRAVAEAPAHAEAHHNLGEALFKLGQVGPALDEFARSASLGGGFLPLTSIAVAIPGSPRADNQAILNARRTWAQRHVPPLGTAKPFPRVSRSADRPLRIGYVSAFFPSPNWMKPVWGLVNRHDRERFEVHLFSDAAESRIEHGCRKHPRDRFHDISKLSNKDTARLVEENAIDILVDLNAFSKVGRLPVLAMKPAPLVVAWFNMFATSGMACYDYLIGDECVIPADEERFYAEQILRVPGCYLTFEVDYPVPEVAPPPCVSGGALTFGCLASQYKITTEVVEAWSRILTECPDSRLLLRNTALGSAANRAFVHDQFARSGIPRERVALDGPAEHFGFLRTYGEIDVALDTFPYNGGTTTTEAIWQGVPVLTFYGDRWVSRTSATILRSGGLGEFVAADLDSCVRQAIALARSPDTPARLAALRRDMRERLRASPVCDTAGLAAAMESLYTQIWTRWCDGA